MWLTLGLLLAVQGCLCLEESRQEAIRVLSSHEVVYTNPPTKNDYRSASWFNPRGMQHLYTINRLFLDLIVRDEVLPQNVNFSNLIDQPRFKLPEVIKEDWEEVLVHNIGVVTVAVCGLILALSLPFACFFMCCFRCAGKCGAYPEHFDKKSDSCKRFCLGIFLAILVIASMFGVVCAFVTNYYCYDGVKKLPSRLNNASEDAAQYLDNTSTEIDTLLVTNFKELEAVLNDILDESGPILKKSLAEVTQAVAIDDLTDIVSNLGNVKRYLKDIQNKSLILQAKVEQLRIGLEGTAKRLGRALSQCTASKTCREFLEEYDVADDLAIGTNFADLPARLPDLGVLMKDISDLMENDIEQKVRGGQKELDRVKDDIERSIEDIRPKIKDEIRRMGDQLEDQAEEIQRFLKEINDQLSAAKKNSPDVEPIINDYGHYAFYVGLGMAFMTFIILICYVFGLFYGFCGKRPGNVYGDDCCNTGTGSNWLLAAVYLTFLFSCVLLIMATAQFLVGSTADKVVCEAVKHPDRSALFAVVDERFVKPMLVKRKPSQYNSADWSHLSLIELINKCHQNMTLYQILRVENIYDVNELRDWRQDYGIQDFIENLKRKIELNDLQRIQILSPEAERELQELAESQISDLNFAQYTKLLEEKITAVDLNTFTARLRTVKDRLSSRQLRAVGAAIENEALFLDQMQRVVMDMKVAMRELVQSVKALEREARLAKPNLREALRELIRQATKATRFLREEGPELITKLTDRYVNETMGMIDSYFERVINHTQSVVGKCQPVSNSYNATVISVCNQIVDPFNGFWTSVGWCVMLFLISIPLSMSLVSLYRKSEPYPGPLVEASSSDREAAPAGSNAGGGNAHAKKKRRGHRRNASEYLPDSAHYRAGYSYSRGGGGADNNRFGDIAPRNQGASSSSAQQSSAPPQGGPPRYSSNPQLENAEYERPPPYFEYAGNDAPPPLPAPNRTRT